AMTRWNGVLVVLIPMILAASTYAAAPGPAVNVVDHGAVGDGIADDTAAIQAALDRGGPVFFPGDAKTVDTYRTLTLRTGNVLYGNATLQLRANQNLAANVYSLAAVGITRFGISGLTFDGNKARQPGTFTANGMLIRGASDFRIQSTRWVN